MCSVDQPCLDERQAIVEFDAIDVEAGLRDTKRGERTPVKDALIREIVDREDRWNVRVVPFQIARNQRALPIVGMDQVGLPALVD